MNYITAKPIDITPCIRLIKEDISYFPGLTVPETEKVLRQAVPGGEVILAKDEGKIIGLLIFRRATAELMFMGVEPEYRGKGIGADLFRYMCSVIPKGKTIKTITFRTNNEDYPADQSYFVRLGFKPGRMMERDGVPSQEFTYENK
ncbi:MAG: GNAT family N-acetyltransferase [Eubacteriaceae bacterium]|jgi:ribosomal protein S18 acetylase RimI-like enzyme